MEATIGADATINRSELKQSFSMIKRLLEVEIWQQLCLGV